MKKSRGECKEKCLQPGNDGWNWKQDFLYLAILAVGITIILIYEMKLWRMDINVPLVYAGGDDVGTIANAKSMMEQLWNLTADRLGAPYITSYYDFTSSVMHNFDLLTLKIFAVLTQDAGIATNMEFLSIPYFCAFISYFVMRDMKIGRWVSVCGSLAFGFSPFIFVRSLPHLVLSTCYFVPLSVLLCIWIYERDDILVLNKIFFKNKRNWMVILFAALIANNGIVYYPFFTCFILMITGLSKAIKQKDFKQLGKAFIVIGMIAIFILIALIPILIHILGNGVNGNAVVRCGFMESELYGLKMIQLLLPMNDHGVPIAKKVIDLYWDNSPLINENVSSYIGLMGDCGFVILMFNIFTIAKEKKSARLHLLSELNIWMIMLGSIGGIGTIFAFIITDKLRGFNRVSIFIGYVCILAFCICFDDFYKKRKNKWIAVAGGLFAVFVCMEQLPTSKLPSYDNNYYNFMSDQEFVQNIETQVEPHSMIYQLPYLEYPEGGSMGNMGDYDLMTGYIHSKTLRWSFGNMKGTPGDTWNKETAQMPLNEMVSYLRNNEFKGIYVDRRAYDKEEIKNLESQLEYLTGSRPLYSNNDNLSFFKFL